MVLPFMGNRCLLRPFIEKFLDDGRFCLCGFTLLFPDLINLGRKFSEGGEGLGQVNPRNKSAPGLCNYSRRSQYRRGSGLRRQITIEQVFSKLKHLLGKAQARSYDAVLAAIGALLKSYPAKECANYLANCGYGAA